MKRGAFLLAVALLLLRVAFFARTDLYPEEAYYWNYAAHLDIGYLDHPPMVAWLIYAGTVIFGDGEFGVRVPLVLCSLVTAFFAYRLTTLPFDARALDARGQESRGVIEAPNPNDAVGQLRQSGYFPTSVAEEGKGAPAGWTAVLLVQVLPFFFLTGFMITPDAPLTACWTGALYFLARALLQEKNQRMAWTRGVPRSWNAVEIFHRVARTRDAGVSRARSEVASLVVASSAVCGGGLGAGDFFACHHLERATRMGILRISKRRSCRREVALLIPRTAPRRVFFAHASRRRPRVAVLARDSESSQRPMLGAYSLCVSSRWCRSRSSCFSA